jgi:hypothetical protein
MATNGTSVCGWAECQACGGKPAPRQEGRVASEAARAAVLKWSGWGALSCDQRRTLALTLDEFAVLQGAKS